MKIGKIIEQEKNGEKVWVAMDPWNEFGIVGIYKGTLSEEDVRKRIAEEMNENPEEDGINELVEGARLEKWTVQE